MLIFSTYAMYTVHIMASVRLTFDPGLNDRMITPISFLVIELQENDRGIARDWIWSRGVLLYHHVPGGRSPGTPLVSMTLLPVPLSINDTPPRTPLIYMALLPVPP